MPYSREVARFALFGGRLPKVKVLTADVPINVNLRSTNPSKSADKTCRQRIFIQICWKETVSCHNGHDLPIEICLKSVVPNLSTNRCKSPTTQFALSYSSKEEVPALTLACGTVALE